jgi:hypothetical protein
MTTLLKKLFGPPEELIVNDPCATHLYRWTILDNKLVKIYLHQFGGNDWSGVLGGLPRRFIAVGLTEARDHETWAELDEDSGPNTWIMCIARMHRKMKAY